MENVLLVVHILACIGLIGVVLLQKSEGGALGMGGGGGGGLMSGRGAASALSRTTMILAGVFMLTSLTLTTIATRTNNSQKSIGQSVAEEELKDLDLTMPSDLGLSEPATVPKSDLSTQAPAEMPSDFEAPAGTEESVNTPRTPE